MSRKHRRNPALDERLETERIQSEVSRQVYGWREAEQRRQDEWRKVEHLPPDLGHTYLKTTGRRRVRNRPEMATCQMPGCTKPSINLMGKLLGICVWCGFDVVTYFDVTDFEHKQRDERKAQLLARRRFLRSQKEAHEEEAAERRRQQPGWIYYLLIADRIKIGYTKDVKRQGCATTRQTHHYWPCILAPRTPRLKCTPGSSAPEQLAVSGTSTPLNCGTTSSRPSNSSANPIVPGTNTVANTATCGTARLLSPPTHAHPVCAASASCVDRRGHGGGVMPDLTVLSDDMLDGVWNRLLGEFAAAKDACDYETMAETHIALEAVIREYDRRTDRWIAAHVKEPA